MKVMSLAVLISGQGTNLQALIKAIDAKKLSATIRLVVSNNPNALGLKWAEHAGLDTAIVDHRDAEDREAFDRQLIDVIQPYGVDYIVLAGFMRRLTPFFVRKFEHRILNIHPSLLPRYPGLHTHERVLAAGDAEHGCSVHYVVDELDAGPVIASARLRVQPADTPEILKQRVHALEYGLYWRVIELICLGSVIFRNKKVFFGQSEVPECGLFLPID